MLRLFKRGDWYWTEGKNSMGITIPRHSIQIRVLDRATKKAAEARVLELEKAPEWPIRKKVIEFPKPDGLTLIDAYDKWLSGYTKDSSTWKAYSSVKRILIEPLALKGVTLVKQVAPAHLNDLQNSWLNGKNRHGETGQTLNVIQTWRKYTSCLFNNCVHIQEEITHNPWRAVPAIKEIKPTREQIMAGQRKDKGIATLPLDLKGDSNWRLIQQHVPAFVRLELPRQTRYRDNPLFQHAATFLTLLRLMYETGLRRGDAVIFRPDWIVDTAEGGSYTTAQIKTGDEVVCFLPQPLVDQLRALPLLQWRGAETPGAGLYPFYDGSSAQEDYLESRLGEPLRELGRLLFGEDSPSLRPHRFRDSFAVNMLNLGLSLQDVQLMLGHKNIATTQKYYAPYVLGMQEAVERRQAAARQAALYAGAQKATVHHVSVN